VTDFPASKLTTSTYKQEVHTTRVLRTGPSYCMVSVQKQKDRAEMGNKQAEKTSVIHNINSTIFNTNKK